jgi:hypothetical protein
VSFKILPFISYILSAASSLPNDNGKSQPI